MSDIAESLSTARRLLLIAAATGGLAAAASADAHHIPGASYEGTTSAGGTVKFTISADGAGVNTAEVTDPGSACGFSSRGKFYGNSSAGPLPITNHAFSDTDPSFKFAGSFDAPQHAQGTFSSTEFGGCSSPPSWTATTPSQPPPACSDLTDNDGDGKVDFPSDPGCSDGSDADESDPSGGGGPSTGGGPAGPGGADTTDPTLALAGAATQRVGSKRTISVEARCPTETCLATAKATVTTSNLAKTYRLKQVSARILAGGTARLTLKMSKTTAAAVRRALKRGRRVRARVTVTATDTAGNRTVRSKTIRLRL